MVESRSFPVGMACFHLFSGAMLVLGSVISNFYSCFTLKNRSPSLFPFQKRIRFIISTPINQKLLVLSPGPHLGLEYQNNVLCFWLELSPRFFSGTNLPCSRKSYAEKTSHLRSFAHQCWAAKCKGMEPQNENFRKKLCRCLPSCKLQKSADVFACVGLKKKTIQRHAAKFVQNSTDKAVTVPFLKRDSKHRSRSSNSAAGLCQRSSQTHHQKSCLLCSTVFLTSFLPSICNMLRTSVSWNFGDLG